LSHSIHQIQKQTGNCDCEAVLNNFRKAGIDLEKLAANLQSQGAKSFDESWQNLLGAVGSKGKELLHAS
jgi:transaldolase